MSILRIPDPSLVVLIGASGAGKSTFARTHFGPFDTVSSDFCRGVVSNDPNDQEATAQAFDLLFDVAARRLDAGLLTVVDATSISPEDRSALVTLAKRHHQLPVAIVLDVGLAELRRRHAARADRDFPASVIDRQHRTLQRGLAHLRKEGFRGVHVLHGPEEITQVRIERTPLRSDRRDEHGPFDIIGDVHGCLDELRSLLDALGYRIDPTGHDAAHPEGRRAVFVGDLVDRGPDSLGVLRLVLGMVHAGHALAVPGNHDAKLVRALGGANVTRNHGLDATMRQQETQASHSEREDIRTSLDQLVAHLVLDDGALVIAHAGLPEHLHNKASGAVREHALYGATTGEVDRYGLPVREDWAADYRGRAAVIYGHTPVADARWVNNTLCIDTGCVFGGSLTALRYPEREIVQVPARRTYADPVRPLANPDARATDLRISDVTGPLRLNTPRAGRITISAQRTAAALETLSRFALPPHLLPYLPPTMAPAPTATQDGFLEHPAPALAYYADRGLEVVCQEKHMGSRAVAYLHTDPQRCYLYTRTGRAFFDQPDIPQALGAAATDLLRALDSEWVLLDGEILPWNLKAQGLIDTLYAPLSAAGHADLSAAAQALTHARRRGVPVPDLDTTLATRLDNLSRFDHTWRTYVTDPSNIRFAPFQILASAGHTHHHRPHSWHLEHIQLLCDAPGNLYHPTQHRHANPHDPEAVTAITDWWLKLTAAGAEGIVIKPETNAHAPAGTQPGLKVRGRDYLRMIYGPDYLDPARLTALRNRNLAPKRTAALREYALGLDGLDKWVAHAPFYQVHQRALAVLALESEGLDPRL
ncbi:polynucleotide kinase-phosphatase [uncultured Corynebacterium sp.]|uniref:polynucleotide kinase-phosphatase n=1 Tax=uncultured Corynebacterium sp. TaxID=159447 RepID=UPI002888FDC2|nr:polynucleotide kinase-phosphatase [uncultured Corynebacterium sp.]